MSRYRRAQMPGATYFFTVNLFNRCSGQAIPDSGLSFSSATAGGSPALA